MVMDNAQPRNSENASSMHIHVFSVSEVCLCLSFLFPIINNTLAQWRMVGLLPTPITNYLHRVYAYARYTRTISRETIAFFHQSLYDSFNK